MSVCPGCGRCRECGQPAPVVPNRWTRPLPNTVPYQPTWTAPNIDWGKVYVGDRPGPPSVTC